MNYWWMNTNPSEWNIQEEMTPGGVEYWEARERNGRYKKYIWEVFPGDRGLCYQTGESGKLVAELKATSSIVQKKDMGEVVRFRLIRFISPGVPWAAIEDADIFDPKSIKGVRRPTLFRLSQRQFGKLLNLSGSPTYSSLVRQDLEALKFEESFQEGGQKAGYFNYYERDPGLREAAIQCHGTVCQVCRFDFSKYYGDRGVGYVEVHHLEPVSKLKRPAPVNPRTDMAVVCANCHRMIHRKRDDVLSLSELKKLVRNQRHR